MLEDYTEDKNGCDEKEVLSEEEDHASVCNFSLSDEETETREGGVLPDIMMSKYE